jgi:hypothetical protein
VRGALPIGACVLGLVATGCGGGARQDKNEPSGSFPVSVTTATFPKHQSLAQKSRMTIAVRNSGTKAIPNVAVTVTAAGEGTAAQAFAEVSNAPGCAINSPAHGPVCQLADRSRPVWVVDKGPGGGVSAYSNTWALGRLLAGRTTTFTWDVTAVVPGTHKLTYRVAAGLNGKAKTRPRFVGGSFSVDITSKPAQAIVTASGKVKRITAK